MRCFSRSVLARSTVSFCRKERNHPKAPTPKAMSLWHHCDGRLTLAPCLREAVNNSRLVSKRSLKHSDEFLHRLAFNVRCKVFGEGGRRVLVAATRSTKHAVLQRLLGRFLCFYVSLLACCAPACNSSSSRGFRSEGLACAAHVIYEPFRVSERSARARRRRLAANYGQSKVRERENCRCGALSPVEGLLEDDERCLAHPELLDHILLHL